MKAKHTQGVWTNCSTHIFAETQTKDGMHNICQLNVKRSEYQANANLISLAPEMLEILQAVLLTGEVYNRDRIIAIIKKATE